MKILAGLFRMSPIRKENHEGSFKGRIVKIHEDSTYTPLTNFFIPGKEKVKVVGK